MIRVVFDLDFDGGFWPGPLAERDAAVGETWCGPAGLLSQLETRLGLCFPFDPVSVRAAALVPAVRSMEGFWHESAKVDPFGTADQLLRWRDYLWLHGWRGQPVSRRLGELADLTGKAKPGIPDRLEAIVREIGMRGRRFIDRLVLFEPVAHFPWAWQALFKALGDSGVRIAVDEPRDHEFPENVTLLRTNGPLSAAHETAAWLSSRDDLEKTVVVSPDALLDDALARFGLPAVGASSRLNDNALLQILPLTLSLAWSPPDPQRALELLSLPVSPVPKGLADRLVRSLHDYPAVNSPLWKSHVARWLEAIEDEEARARLQERLGVLFGDGVAEERYPVDEIRKRCTLLSKWARGRMAGDEKPEWFAVLSQVQNLQRLIDLSGLDRFTAAQMRRLIEDATRQAPNTSRREARAGLHALERPAGIAGPARRVVWWNFTRDAVDSPESMPLSREERRGLSEAGVILPDPAEEALRAAARWYKPIFFARGDVILVCPRFGEDGAEAFPHPLWDELSASADGRNIREKGGLADLVPREKRTFIPLPGPVHQWCVKPEAIGPRDKESPSSLNKFISCPFQWAVKYLGGVWGGRSASLPDDETLEGSLIHAILEILLKRPLTTPEDARRKAEALFDEYGPELAAPFFLKGNEVRKAEVRRGAALAAEDLVRYILDRKFTVRAVEETCCRHFDELGIDLEGRPDLVLDSPPAVIDFKRSGDKFRRDQLIEGAYDQLTVYSRLVQGIGPPPATAYYIFSKRRLLANDPDVFPRSDLVDGPGPDEVWGALTKSFHERRRELREGVISAPGVHPEASADEKSRIEGGCLRLQPACRFCDLTVLCGALFKETS